MTRDCIVYDSTLKKEIRYRGKFHGFFQVELRDEYSADSYPVALVEKPDGKVNEVLIQYFGFDNEEPLGVLLNNVPKYKAHAQKVKGSCLN